jgi:Pregnancy-associated plasma protein-A
MHDSRRCGWGLVLSAVVSAALVGCDVGDGGEPGVDDVEFGSAAREVTGMSSLGVERCGSIEPGIAEQDEADAVAADLSLLRVEARKERIPVHFHIITSSDGQGDVSDLVPAQMNVLNLAFERAGFRFRLAGVHVIPSDSWYAATLGSPEEVAMKQALRRGDAGTLNIYTGINNGALLGWATFPSSYEADPSYDGVVVLDISLPGGGLEIPDDEEPDGVINYSGGDTGTHEVGHWLGLFHTFQGGCTKRNDRIADTPAEAVPQFICVDRDSCTGRKFPGTDPIHNFMDYVDDDCMDQFTTDQEDRMQRQFNAFRG